MSAGQGTVEARQLRHGMATAEDMRGKLMPPTRKANVLLPEAYTVRPPVGVTRGAGPVIDLKALLLPGRVRAVRVGDLVDLSFRFRNLRLREDGDRLVLARSDSSKPARLFVTLPAQHVAEDAYVEVAAGDTGGADPKDTQSRPRPNPPAPMIEPPPWDGVAVPTLISGPSQLVLDVKDETVDFTLAGLLDAIRRLPMVVGRNAPAPPETGIFTTTPIERWLSDRTQLRALIRKAGGTLVAPSDDALPLLRSNAIAIEHRFGPDAAVEWLLGQVAVVKPDRVLPGTRLPKLPARPGDPFPADLTGIEIPFRLLLSPHAGEAFALRSTDPTAAGPVELWHARLGLRGAAGPPAVDERASGRRTVRAVWARDRDVLNLPGPDLPLPDPFARGGEPTPLRLSLNSNDRMSIVHQTSDFALRTAGGKKPWTPSAVPVDRLILSTLGGWLDSGVSWGTQPDGFELEEWRHLATLGRDHYVRVVRAGFLFPTGHRASLVKVTERKFHVARKGNPAFLRQRFFIVVREPYRLIPGLGSAAEDRRNPFHDVRITTVVTPSLDPPVLHPVAAVSKLTCFQPALNGVPFEFQALVTDRTGNVVEVPLPLLFVGKSANDDSAFVDAIVAAYDGMTDAKTVQGNALGQRMAFAASAVSGDTELAASTLRLAARRRSTAWDGRGPRFGPVLASAAVAIPAIGQLTGRGSLVDVEWPAAYLANGVDGAGNGGQVFLQLRNPTPLDFAEKKDRSGALVAPNMSVKGVSRAVGPIGVDPGQFAAGTLDPVAMFAGALSAAKLFGVVPLAELIEKATNAADSVVQAPKFLTEALTKIAGLQRDARELVALLGQPGLPGGPAVTAVRTGVTDVVKLIDAALTAPASADAAALAVAIGAVLGSQAAAVAELAGVEFAARRRILGPLDRIAALGTDAVGLATEALDWVNGITAPSGIRTRVVWHPRVKDWGTTLRFDDQARALSLAIDLANPPGSSQPLVDVSCSVEGVTVDLAVVALKIDLIRFTVRGGRKPDIEVRMADPGGVLFGGPLAFVDTLRSLIPIDGFSDPPSVDVGPDGLTAGFSLALPNLAVGIFSLENLTLSAALNVPFVGESLSFRFAFCSREKPFHLIVSLFGGGGFVGIELTPKGLRMVEASLEFGAAVSLDFGVASGSLSVMAGIYFRWTEGQGVLVSGYFRARGEVDVLGLISASIELTISLTWQEPNKVSGRATLTIEVEVLFFSASVSISCEKRFAGSGADPTFREVMGPVGGRDPWQEYCQAFGGI